MGTAGMSLGTKRGSLAGVVRPMFRNAKLKSVWLEPKLAFKVSLEVVLSTRTHKPPIVSYWTRKATSTVTLIVTFTVTLTVTLTVTYFNTFALTVTLINVKGRLPEIPASRCLCRQGVLVSVSLASVDKTTEASTALWKGEIRIRRKNWLIYSIWLEFVEKIELRKTFDYNVSLKVSFKRFVYTPSWDIKGWLRNGRMPWGIEATSFEDWHEFK